MRYGYKEEKGNISSISFSFSLLSFFFRLLPSFITHLHSNHRHYIIGFFSFFSFLTACLFFFILCSFISIDNRHRWQLCGLTTVSKGKNEQKYTDGYKGQGLLSQSKIVDRIYYWISFIYCFYYLSIFEKYMTGNWWHVCTRKTLLLHQLNRLSWHATK